MKFDNKLFTYDGLYLKYDGRFVARRKVDAKGIYTPIITEGAMLFVMGNSGKLSAFELQ